MNQQQQRERDAERMRKLRARRRKERMSQQPDPWYVPAVIVTPRGRIHRCADEGLKEGDYV